MHPSIVSKVQNYFNRGDFVGIEQDLHQAIREDPTDPIPYVFRAVYRHICGDYKGALQDYTATLERECMHAVVYNNRAICYMQLAEYDLAQRSFAKAVELLPDYGLWLHNWSNIFLLKKDIIQAIDFHEKAIVASPQWIEGYMLEGLRTALFSLSTMKPYPIFPCLICNLFPDFWKEYEKIMQRTSQ